MCLSMVITQDSGSNDPERHSASDDVIRRIVATEVATTIREAIPKMFGSVKTTLIKTFDNRYVAVTEAAAAVATATLATVRPQEVIRWRIRSSPIQSHPSLMVL